MARQRNRRRATDDEGIYPSAGVSGTNKIAVRAFRLSLWAMIPGLGLFFGPVATALGCLARYKGKGDPAFTFQSAALVAILLGSLTTVTNWLGLTLMFLGWKSMELFSGIGVLMLAVGASVA